MLGEQLHELPGAAAHHDGGKDVLLAVPEDLLRDPELRTVGADDRHVLRHDGPGRRRVVFEHRRSHSTDSGFGTVQDCGMTRYSPVLSIFVLAPRLRRASNRAVSIFLPARSEGYDARFYDIEFRDLLHRYTTRLAPQDRELMSYGVRRLRHHRAAARPAGCPACAGVA